MRGALIEVRKQEAVRYPETPRRLGPLDPKRLRRCQTARIGHHQVAVALEEEEAAVGRVDRSRVTLQRARGQLPLVAARRRDREEPCGPVAVAGEHHALSARRPDRILLVEPQFGQALEPARFDVGDVDVVVAADVAGERDLRAVGRPGKPPDRAAHPDRLLDAAADRDDRHARAGDERKLLPVRRPGRPSLLRRSCGNRPLARAVDVANEDVAAAHVRDQGAVRGDRRLGLPERRLRHPESDTRGERSHEDLPAALERDRPHGRRRRHRALRAGDGRGETHRHEDNPAHATPDHHGSIARVVRGVLEDRAVLST